MSTANALPVSHANYRYATDATISELASPKKKNRTKGTTKTEEQTADESNKRCDGLAIRKATGVTWPTLAHLVETFIILSSRYLTGLPKFVCFLSHFFFLFFFFFLPRKGK